jgi:hypothetical protein
VQQGASAYKLCIELGQSRLTLAIEDQKSINHVAKLRIIILVVV